MNHSIEHAFKERIRKIAREKRVDPAQLWQNLVLERFLIRLSRSKYSSHFILKGGVLLAQYIDLNRHTQDLDFLVQKLSNGISELEKVFSDIIQTEIEDGFQFSELKVNDLLHSHMKYPGIRATMWSFFGKTRFRVKIDLGFGDVITPIKMPIALTRGNSDALFESEVEITCYPKEYIFAEKLETVIYRGVNNSRMKDFHDLHMLIESGNLQVKEVEPILLSVFEHRKTNLNFPVFFAKKELESMQQLWTAYLRGLPKGHSMPKHFGDIISQLNYWLKP